MVFSCFVGPVGWMVDCFEVGLRRCGPTVEGLARGWRELGCLYVTVSSVRVVQACHAVLGATFGSVLVSLCR